MLRTLASIALTCLACTGGSHASSDSRTSRDPANAPDSTPTDGPHGPVSPPAPALTRFLREGQHFGTTADEIRAQLGPPDSVAIDPSPSPDEQGQPDTLVRLYYATAIFGLYRATNGHHEMLNEVIVDTAGVSGLGIRVGSGRQNVISVLGRPRHIDRDRAGVEILEYEQQDHGSTVRLFIFDGLVRRIEW